MHLMLANWHHANIHGQHPSCKDILDELSQSQSQARKPEGGPFRAQARATSTPMYKYLKRIRDTHQDCTLDELIRDDADIHARRAEPGMILLTGARCDQLAGANAPTWDPATNLLNTAFSTPTHT